MKQFRKPLSILLSILMILSMFTIGTVAVSAADESATVPDGYITVFFTDKLGWGENLSFNFLEEGELLNKTDSMTFVETNEAGENIYKYSFDPTITKSFSFSNPSNKNKTESISAADFKNGRGYYCDGDPIKTGPFSTYYLSSYTYFEEPEIPTTAIPTVPAAPDSSTYIVAGVSSLCSSNWDASDSANSMIWDGSVYAKTYSSVAAGTGYQFKVVKNGSEWIGDATGNNITFNVTSACDVTVTYNPATGEIAVIGSDVVLPKGIEIDAMRTVGNGSGKWLNGANWDPASNLNVMTETAPGIYTVIYEDIPAGTNYQFKFAANGSWTDNWGGVFTASGEWTDANYNDQRNITVASTYKLADITVTLDLSAFNYSTKSGAKFKIDIVDVSVVETTAPVATEPTQTEPVITEPIPTEPIPTEPVVTEPIPTEPIPTEPVVTEPTPTEPIPTEPVVTEPTPTEPIPTEPVVTEPIPTEPIPTEPVVTEPAVTDPIASEPIASEPITEDTYIIAGVDALCGSAWDGADTANTMTKDGGIYTKTYLAVAEGNNYQFKVVKNGSEWIGDATGNNITFNVITACDVTITYNPLTNEITVTGEGVEIPESLVIDCMHTVGNGDGVWLNGADWNPADDLNLMEEISDGVYTITYKGIEAYDNYQVKFAANDSWAANWSGTFTASGEWCEAIYNGQENITVAFDYALADITITIDLTEFDFATKTGAKFKIDIAEVETPKFNICDVDRDGRITVKDATLIQKYLADMETLDDEQLELADSTCDGKINIQDATYIQKQLTLPE